MKGNIRFIICVDGAGFKIICAHGTEEVTWIGFKSLSEVGRRIALACKNLEKL